jgi:hypothetical protein
LATILATATTAATKKITAIVMTVGSRDARCAIDPAVRGGSGGLMGGVSPGAGAQGTKDGPLGVGPMPVLAEPLGSSISDHGSAGLACCRDRVLQPVVHRTATRSVRCPQIYCWPTHSTLRPQPDGMTSSKKSARRKPARRRRQQAQPRLRVRRPDELLAIIPYLVGFHPDESIVAVFIKSGRVLLTARMDLPSESSGDELAERIDWLARKHAAQALALVAYSADTLPAHRLLTRLMDRLGEHELTDVLYVGHGRWWSLSCGDECCPFSGTPFDPSSHPLSAAAVFAGLGARADRRELEASVSGPSEEELPRLRELADALLAGLEQLDDPRAAVRLLGSIVETAISEPAVPEERTCLLLGLLVTDVHIRDLAWALITPTNAEDHVRLWGGVVAQVPPTLAAAPLCLLGMAAWVSGAGALLNCCCERLAQIDPDYSMGRLLADISERAVPPSLWQQMGDEMQAELRAEPGMLAG